MTKELDRIRLRRTDKSQVISKTFDDAVLIFGSIAGISIFWSVSLLSSGMLAGDSIFLDEKLSKTPLDTGGECVDNQGAVSFSIFVENHDEVKIRSKNVQLDRFSVLVVKTQIIAKSESFIEFYRSDLGNVELSFELESDIQDGTYLLSAHLSKFK